MKQKHHIFSVILSVILSVMLFAAALPASAIETDLPTFEDVITAAYDTVETGQYYLKNKSTGTYIAVDGAKAANGQNISVSAKKETSAFQFGISGSAANGYYLTSQLNPAFVINPYADAPANGTNITLYKKNTDGTQLFYFESVSGGYCLRSKYNSKLAVTVSGTNVKLATYSGADTQIWSLEKASVSFASVSDGNYYLKNSSTGTYLSVDDAKAANGQNISVSAKKTKSAYIFNFSGNAANGYYISSLLNTAFVVNPYSDTPVNGTNITLYKKAYDGTQNWHLEKSGSGYVIHNNYNTSLVLGVNGSNTVLQNNLNTAEQIWILEAAKDSDATDNSGYTAQKEGYYFLKNVSTGSYMSFSNAANGQEAVMAKKTDTNGFKFHLTGDSSNGYLLASALNEAFVINPYANKPENGTKVTLYKKSGDGTQNWFFKKKDNGFTLHNSYANNLVITAGKALTISTNSSSDAQTWILEAAEKSEDTKNISYVQTHIEPFKFGVHNWNFSNSSVVFSEGYKIDSKILNDLSNAYDLSNKDKKRIKNYRKRQWNGSCYGFTVSALLSYEKKLSLSSYGGNDIVTKNEPTSEMKSLINFYQATQSLSKENQKIRAKSFFSPSDQSVSFFLINEHFKNGGGPFNLGYSLEAVNSKGNVEGEFGHSVICYGITTCKDFDNVPEHISEVNNKAYDCMLLLADPNPPSYKELTDEACMYFNSKDGSWIIEYWNGRKCTVNKKQCVYKCYWNANSKDCHGELTALKTYNGSLDDGYETDHYLAGIELFSTSSDDYLIDFTGSGGNDLYNAGTGDGIAPVSRLTELSDEDDENIQLSNEYALWNPTSNYCLVYDAPESYDLTMDYENVAYFAEAENAVYTEFSPEGKYIVEGSSLIYDVSIVTEDDASVTDWYCMSVSGSNTDTLDYHIAENGYILSADHLDNVTVSAENDDISAQLTFSTDAKKVLIYEIAPDAIGVAIDSDHDGEFETTIASNKTEDENDPTLGDVISDGKIDAKDASAILLAYSKMSTGGENVLTEAQMAVSDVNYDGKTDAKDSSCILSYYAYSSTSSGDILTLIDFLAQKEA